MAQVRPTELSTVQAAAALIAAAQVNASPLVTKVVPRWVLGLAVGDAVSHLTTLDGDSNPLSINSWVLTTASWLPSKATSPSGAKQTPKNFTPGFDDWQPVAGGGDLATQIDYKIALTGSLKIWQLVEYRQGDDLDNSERDCMTQRQAVIDKYSASPRLGLEWADFEHDELKFTNFAVIPFGTSLIHVAQGSLSFNFSYVASAA